MEKGKETKPGEGLGSLKTTSFFRALNFELYVKPNKIIMGVGVTVFLSCLGYIMYMQHKYESLGYYPGIKEDGTKEYIKKKSNWD